MKPNLGPVTTGELLDELDKRNEVGQRAKFQNNVNDTTELIKKLRQSFIVRVQGLQYRSADNEIAQ
jgi:hypothetical protein